MMKCVMCVRFVRVRVCVLLKKKFGDGALCFRRLIAEKKRRSTRKIINYVLCAEKANRVKCFECAVRAYRTPHNTRIVFNEYGAYGYGWSWSVCGVCFVSAVITH